MSDKEELSEVEKKCFDAVDKNDTILLKTLLTEVKNVDILDENAMTLLQHAAYKGNKEMVQMLIDQGCDVNLCEHQHDYTALHFAGLSGNVDVCMALLLAGANSNILNTVGKTASQMAAFVGHHNCTSTINNYVPKKVIEYYLTNKPILPGFLLNNFHKFVMQINLNPVKIVLNLQNLIGLSEHLKEIKDILENMRDKEMKKVNEINEVMSFKFHYLSCIVNEIIKLKERQTDTKDNSEITEIFIKKILKPNNENYLEFMDNLLKEYVKEFPYRDCILFRQMLASLTYKDAPSTLSVITAAINGQRGFIDTLTICNTCGDEKPTKKCSKCKTTQYCDKICQRLHWHWHKKVCGKIEQNQEKVVPDAKELSTELQNLLV